MAQPKDTYTFSSTREGCNFSRIVRENPYSPVIVLSRKAPCPTITLVPDYQARKRLTDAGINPMCFLPFNEAGVYAGDVHAVALGIIETKVEAY